MNSATAIRTSICQSNAIASSSRARRWSERGSILFSSVRRPARLSLRMRSSASVGGGGGSTIAMTVIVTVRCVDRTPTRPEFSARQRVFTRRPPDGKVARPARPRRAGRSGRPRNAGASGATTTLRGSDTPFHSDAPRCPWVVHSSVTSHSYRASRECAAGSSSSCCALDRSANGRGRRIGRGVRRGRGDSSGGVRRHGRGGGIVARSRRSTGRACASSDPAEPEVLLDPARSPRERRRWRALPRVRRTARVVCPSRRAPERRFRRPAAIGRARRRPQNPSG